MRSKPAAITAASRTLWAVLPLALLLAGLAASTSGPASTASAQQSCSPGTVFSPDAGVCVSIVPDAEPTPADDEPIVPFQGSDGIRCPDGLTFNDDFSECIDPTPTPEPAPTCDEGYSLGADDVTCVADVPDCGDGKILGDSGNCERSFNCSEGLILTSDLLSCTSSGCPSGEIVSVDGKRCLAPDLRCPNGSLRPVGGACLVVEADDDDADGSDGVAVRCATGDQFCQALVKQCAEERAAGNGDENCEDPRGTCLADDSDCEQANDRLAECAALLESDEDVGAACRDLCPRLHELDASGQCVEYLDPTHPCVSSGSVPSSVTSNEQLDFYSYLAGTGQCVTRVEFLRRLGNFEAAAEAEAGALAVLRDTTLKYLTVQEQLAVLDEQLEEAVRQVESLRDEAAEADELRAETEAKLEETTALLEIEREIMRLEVLGFFVSGGDQAIVGAVLSASNISEIGLAESYGRLILRNQAETVDRFQTLETEAVELGDELDQAIIEVEDALNEAQDTQLDVESLLADTAKIREQQLARRDLEAELVSDLRADKAAYARELGVFDQASREIADIISESEFLVTEFRDFDGLFANPVIPARAGSGFGPRLHPILGYVRNHDGVDFDADFGESIYAVAPGVVQIASTFGGYGQTVVLDHGGGLLTLYAHMSGYNVEPGDEVERGDVLGFIGSTGLSTGPHLHFEVWVDNGTAVDPAPYLTASE